MEQIYPLKEEIISRYCGMPVCAVMKNGIRYVGTLSASRAGAVHLDIGFGSPYHPGPFRPGVHPGHMGDSSTGSGSQHEGDGADPNEQKRTTGVSNPAATKKKKRIKASASSSTNKYAKKASNPAAREKDEQNSSILTLKLDDILFLVRIV